MRLKRGDMVLVDWIDSMSYTRWREPDEIDDFIEDEEDIKHRTCGFYWGKNKVSTTIAQNIALDWSHIADCMKIPNKAITKIAILSPKRNKK